MPFLVGDYMKKLKYILLIIMLFITKNVYADTIYRVDMDIYLDESGNAKVKEVWDVKASTGSEWYKTMYNIGNEEVTNYKVSMDGTELKYKSWDVDESISEKAGYYGINHVSEGIELCFGKKDYKRHTFTLTYDLSNVIFNTEDNQVLYQTLLPKAKLNDFYVKVHSFYEFPDNLDVWGYGYNGYAYVYNGYIEMSNKENTNLNNEYVVLLVKFPLNTFKTSNNYDYLTSFNDVFKMAEEGKFDYKTKINFWNILKGIISFAISFLLPVIIIIFAASNSTNGYGTKKLKFTKDGKKVKDAPYFREIPLNKDIFAAYWFACQYGLVKNKTDFLGTILLKWLKDGNVENVTVTSKILKKEERAIKLLNKDSLKGLEIELYDMMYAASLDGTLESNEFTRWCKNHYNKILKWFNRVIDEETSKLVNAGLIVEDKKFYGTVYNVSDVLKEDALKISGLKKFLNDFSNIKERESIEVKLWEYYLMYAQIFGIAKKVAKEFKKLYPDVLTDEQYNDVMFIHTISADGVSAASVAKSRAESYSAGGGGFSSGGGGGGSFGGGGGMGGR